jgi:isoprenylcysteine carboxyl methyltransferase (ICMT) family protein YpbQ
MRTYCVHETRLSTESFSSLAQLLTVFLFALAYLRLNGEKRSIKNNFAITQKGAYEFARETSSGMS